MSNYLPPGTPTGYCLTEATTEFPLMECMACHEVFFSGELECGWCGVSTKEMECENCSKPAKALFTKRSENYTAVLCYECLAKQ